MNGLTPAELAMAARLVRDLPRFLRAPIAPETAAALVKRRLERRAANFLALVESAVYRYPRSPYRRLLRSVGCEPGDLRALVAGEGLEGALGQLADRGVYLTFDEFKGRREIVRGSERYAPAQSDFDNPRWLHHFETQTGGSGGAPTRVKMPLAMVGELAVSHASAAMAHDLAEADNVIWGMGPFSLMLRYARLGRAPVAWFYPLEPLPWKVRAAGLLVRALGVLAGCPLPGPAWLDFRDPALLARWLVGGTARGRRYCVTTYTSSAVRVAEAARADGLSLEGVTFMVHGEPFTAARQAALESVGTRALVNYGTMEAPTIGYRCATPGALDDCHVYSDVYGLVQRSRPAGALGVSVDAFLITTLLPPAPKIMLNVEIGDYGLSEQRDCGCGLGALGLRLHVSNIRSHEKLTGEGMTFVRTRLLPVLEDILPGRFGGSGADYQVLEEDDSNGVARLYLLVSPRVGALDEAEVKRTFLAELGRGGELPRFMARVWEQAGTVQVRRQTPISTGAGKILPFHVARREPAGRQGQR